MQMRDFEVLVRRCWVRETSAAPELWSPQNPSRGQCAITALLIQDEFGGDLLRGVVSGESHYWNRLPDGTVVDLTLEQFGGEKAVGFVVRDRGYVLSFEATRCRYDLLRSKFEALCTGS